MLRDKRVRFAFVIAIVEWVVIGGLVTLLDDVSPLAIGVVLMVATWLQLGALFYRRQPTGEFAEAQQLFVQGNYAEAATKLESLPEPDEQAQTLLGNTYRQMGKLQESESVLRTVLDKNPNAAFPLYGLGRTLLAQGKFDNAAENIQQALDHNGRKAIRVELALAYYLGDHPEKATEEAKRAARSLGLEAFRVLMVNYILHCTDDDPRAPDMIQRASDGLGYWQAEAKRFADTPYGKRLMMEVQAIRQLLDITP